MYLGFEHLPLAGDLPVFRRLNAEAVLYYTPGYVLHALHEAREGIEAQICGQVAPVHPGVVDLLQYARQALTRWNNLHRHPYTPLCLTVYPQNRCNLRCVYCYADPTSTRSAAVRPETIRAAAQIVARNCQAKQRPFTLVVHGGGEPTLNFPALTDLLQTVKEVAAEHGLELFRYIATNGVMPVARAGWLAENFDLVGLSCDGPENIQARQRPRLDGRSSLPAVERTAEVLHKSRRLFNLRVTLTPQTIDRLEEIINYIQGCLRPEEIHVEPVYQGGRASGDPAEEEAKAAARADSFAEHFLHVKQSQPGARLLFAGTRPGEIHGPYCQVFRDVLNLVPGGVATACFKLSDAAQVDKQSARIGTASADGFSIDMERIQSLREQLAEVPARCEGCFNHYHCARGCPDACPLEDDTMVPVFRCRMQMRLSAAQIEQAGAGLAISTDQPVIGSRVA